MATFLGNPLRPSPHEMLLMAAMDPSKPPPDPGTYFLPNRIRSLRIGYTQAALRRNELEHETILAVARSVGAEFNVTLLEYSIATERHAFPRYPGREWHYHAFFHYDGVVTINDRRTSTLFHLRGDNHRVLRPALQCVEAKDCPRYINFPGCVLPLEKYYFLIVRRIGWRAPS